MDAALDEPNQARVADLLRRLAHGSGGSGCQVLAVTHNAAFQAFGQTVQVAALPSSKHLLATQMRGVALRLWGDLAFACLP